MKRCDLCDREYNGARPACQCMVAAKRLPRVSAMHDFVKLVRAGVDPEHAGELASGRAGKA